MTSSQNKNLIIFTGVVAAGTILLDARSTTSSKRQGSIPGKGDFHTLERFLALTAFIFVTWFLSDMAPDFIGPLVLLILVVLLVRETPKIKKFYNSSLKG